ncbi:MAG: sensor histidine kinase [Rhizomicrobium sp.]
MTVESLKTSLDPPSDPQFAVKGGRSVASYERELYLSRVAEARLREALAQDELLLGQKDAQIQQQLLLSRESDHRLLNDLQIIVSLLSLQSRSAGNAETAGQLKVAADRVGMIVRVHQRLHSHDGAHTVAFKQYVEELSRDFSVMTSSGGTVEVIFDDGKEVELPAAIGIPLGFIVSELLTNAAKHGKGRVALRFSAKAEGGYMLSVSNDGVPLAEDFDPTAGRGLGMKIVKSFVDRIGGELRFGRGDGNQGARFTVAFS